MYCTLKPCKQQSSSFVILINSSLILLCKDGLVKKASYCLKAEVLHTRCSSLYERFFYIYFGFAEKIWAIRIMNEIFSFLFLGSYPLDYSSLILLFIYTM